MASNVITVFMILSKVLLLILLQVFFDLIPVFISIFFTPIRTAIMQASQSLYVIIGKSFRLISQEVTLADLTGDRRVIHLSMVPLNASVKEIHWADLVNAKGSFLGIERSGVVAAFDCGHCTEQVFLGAIIATGKPKGYKGDDK